MFSLVLKGGKDAISDWKSGRCIWASTIKTFKGLEADCIIVTDCSVEDFTEANRSELYVGTTRAKNQLIIIPANKSSQERLENIL